MGSHCISSRSLLIILLCWAQVPNSAYQTPRSLALWFGEEDFKSIFTIYGHGGHLGHEA